MNSLPANLPTIFCHKVLLYSLSNFSVGIVDPDDAFQQSNILSNNSPPIFFNAFTLIP